MTDKPEPGPVMPEPGHPSADHKAVPLAQSPNPAAEPVRPTNGEAPPAAPAPATPVVAAPPAAGETPSGLPPGAWAPPPGWVPVGYAAAPSGAVPPATAGRRSWRAWPGWRRSLVPGLVGLILGGLLGSGITALATHDDGNPRVPVSRFGPGRDGIGPGYGNGFGPGSRGGDGFGNRGQYGTPPNGGQTVPTPQPTTS
jgi:hypothetical protein